MSSNSMKNKDKFGTMITISLFIIVFSLISVSIPIIMLLYFILFG